MAVKKGETGGRYFAHTDPLNPGKLPENGANWQKLEDHLKDTAKRAEKFASAFNADHWGYLAGLWHDVGKYSNEFQQMLRDSVDAHIEQKSKIDHSTAGSKNAYKWSKDAGKILAYAIAGHHGGLPDGKSNESCLATRLEKTVFSLPPEVDDLFLQQIPELPFSPDKARFCFELSFFVRMIYSCLVDADFLDTEKCMDLDKSLNRCGYPTVQQLQSLFSNKLDNLRVNFAKTDINKIRSEILSQCLNAADISSGLFSLTVPTGGGKTLSSMAFALKHAINNNNFKRIIYVIPYTSIIEQNAQVFREILGEDAVVEHHSNYEPAEEDCRTRLASENWDAPIIVTTNVQFFESLFSNRSSRCRKLHNIAQSVIILDEVQTLPDSLLLPCIEALRELTLHYQTTIVLCSATQPAIQKREEFIKGLEDVREIIKNPKELSEKMKRVKVTNLSKQTDDQIISKIKQHNQVLCVVNTKKHAKTLFERLNDEKNIYHLSALMYPSHRSCKLEEIRDCLKNSKQCIVISTQLIEAGVDIDFPVVLRAVSGLDSIAQAAGRCNREGKLAHGEAYVFEPEEGLPPGYFRQTAQTTQSVIRRFPCDVLSLDAIEQYFKDYYWLKGENQLDKKSILTKLQEGMRACDFPFKQIAQEFQLIEQQTKPVIIALDKKTEKIIEQIRYADYLRGFSRKLQKYTVQVYPWHWQKLNDAGCLEIVRDIFPVLICKDKYSNDTGLDIWDSGCKDPEDLIF